MLGRAEQIQPAFVDFQNFAQGFGFHRLVGRLFFMPGSFEKPTR